MKKTDYRIIALTLFVIAFSISSAFAQEYRNFTGSNGRIIEAAFLGFDEATQIVKLRLKDGREQNVKLDLFAAESQQWIKSGGKDADNPFGDDAPQQQSFRSAFTDIFEAANKGTAQDVKYHLERGADIEGKKGGHTPLHLAAAYNPNVETTKFLVSKGANIRARCDGSGMTPFIEAVSMGQVEVAQFLLSVGSDVNAKLNNGGTGLHIATERGHVETVKFLVSKGLDVNAKNNDGKSPLDLARERNKTELVRYLEGQTSQPFDNTESDFEWLFDGRSLNGWEGDTNAWRVDQNEKALINTGKGNLFTTKQYDNFIIQLEFRCEERANNGLMIRVDNAARRDVSRAMKIQIADDRGNMSGRDHNGSIHGSLSGPKPDTFYDRGHPHIRGWNFMEVIADGQKITTYVNGMKVVDDTPPQDKPFSNVRSGHIGFMGDGGTTAIRYIRIKPLKAGEDWRTSKIAVNDSREGFIPIFDGRTLNGWRGDQGKFRGENNTLTQFDTPGSLETIKEYRNFALRFEFRLVRGADSGVHIRQSNDKRAFEIQIRDDFNANNNDIAPSHVHGSIVRVVPARRGSLNSAGQWNTMEIVVNGLMVRIIVNDQIVVDTCLRDFDVNQIPQWVVNLELPGFHNKSGHVVFSGMRGQTEFRNIRIKELP